MVGIDKALACLPQGVAHLIHLTLVTLVVDAPCEVDGASEECVEIALDVSVTRRAN